MAIFNSYVKLPEDIPKSRGLKPDSSSWNTIVTGVLQYRPIFRQTKKSTIYW